MKHDIRKPVSATEFEALGLSVTPILGSPAGFTRTDDLPDWPTREPRRSEPGSAVLRWMVTILVLGLIGLALVTPTLSGGVADNPAYATD